MTSFVLYYREPGSRTWRIWAVLSDREAARAEARVLRRRGFLTAVRKEV